jgi:hypothetical protein
MLSRINEQIAHEYREAKKFQLAMEHEDKRKRNLTLSVELMEPDEFSLNYRIRAV